MTLALLSLTGCGDDDVVPMEDGGVDAGLPDVGVDAPPVMQPTLSEEHVYRRVTPPFASADECRASDEDLLCLQRLVFCPGGDFTLNLTETVNAGGYALRPGNVIQALRRGEGDGPMRFSGVIDEDAGTFTSETEELAGQWERVVGDRVCL